MYSEALGIRIHLKQSSFICYNDLNNTAMSNSINVYDPNNASSFIEPTTYL